MAKVNSPEARPIASAMMCYATRRMRVYGQMAGPWGSHGREQVKISHRQPTGLQVMECEHINERQPGVDCKRCVFRLLAPQRTPLLMARFGQKRHQSAVRTVCYFNENCQMPTQPIPCTSRRNPTSTTRRGKWSRGAQGRSGTRQNPTNPYEARPCSQEQTNKDELSTGSAVISLIVRQLSTSDHCY